MIITWFAINKKISIIVFLNLFLIASTYHYAYTRVSNCIMETQIGCAFWQSKLEFQKQLDPSCFPEQTYLQGRNNRIRISELKVGDQVLVYQQYGVAFEQVKAWLHRDVKQQFIYTFLNYQTASRYSFGPKQITQSGFFISGMHNIALLNNKSNQIEYSFAQNVKQNDILYGYGPHYGSQTPRITKITKNNIKNGIYAPYTKSGNYFITNSKNNQQLILVHCFAHVSTKYHYLFDILINLFPSRNIQPSQDSYIHPLSSFLKDLFPSVVETKALNHLASKFSNNHNFYDKEEREYSQYRYVSDSSKKDFIQQRKIMIVIDKILSMVEVFV